MSTKSSIDTTTVTHSHRQEQELDDITDQLDQYSMSVYEVPRLLPFDAIRGEQHRLVSPKCTAMQSGPPNSAGMCIVIDMQAVILHAAIGKVMLHMFTCRPGIASLKLLSIQAHVLKR